MSKELYFTDGNNEVKYLDTTASFNLAITQDGSAFDLTNAKTIDVKVANDTGYVFTKSIDMTTIKRPLAGLITMPVDAEVMNALVPDDYTIEVWVTLSSLITPGSQEGLTDGATSVPTTDTTTYNAIFPSDDPQGFTITENVMSDSGDVIPVMSLDEFQQDFDQLKTDLTNKVSTLKGPKGETGQGLEIKGKVDTTSQLPATASEGDGYLVNEELYVWTNGAWKDCGSLQGPQGVQGKTGTGVSSTTIQYQISNSATTTPTGTWSNSLIATTQVNPFLWTQVTLNYDDGTSKSFYLVSSKGDKGDKGDTGATGPVGPPGPVGAGLVVKGTVKDASQLPKTGNQEGYCYFVGTDLYVWDAGAWKNCGSVSPDLSNYVTVTDLNNGLSTKVTDNKNGTEQLNGVQVKPFNKLSDTIGGRNLLPISNYDSGYVSSVGSVAPQTAGKEVISDFAPVDTTQSYYCQIIQQISNNLAWYGIGFYDNNKQFISRFENGHTNVKGTITSVIRLLPFGVPNISIPNVSTVDFPANTAYVRISFSTYGKPIQASLEKSSVLSDWTPAPEDKVNVSDMRKPASDVAGIEEVNAKQDKIGYTPADDSKVAHLSGANNFDTVPTVKNNPLLLANSLPSELARTGSNQEFTGKNTFDVAPIDKKTGNPYITKDGVPAVPSTLADTTKDANFTGKLQKSGIDVATKSDVTTAVSTATANMVDSSKPTNFTAGLQSGGVDVATAADLKSVKDSAWRELDFGSDANLGGALASSYIVYKIHADEKYLSFLFSGIPNPNFQGNSENFTLMDLSSIVKGISSIDFSTTSSELNDYANNSPSFSISGTKIITKTGTNRMHVVSDTVSLSPLNHADRRIYYTELV